jgi:hypothetical protein
MAGNVGSFLAEKSTNLSVKSIGYPFLANFEDKRVRDNKKWIHQRERGIFFWCMAESVVGQNPPEWANPLYYS